jgi:RNA polymerase sigma-70 factor (ECF subfamily)
MNRAAGGNALMADRMQAVALAPAAERAVFEDLYAQYKSPLYNYIYRLMGDRDQADDLLQETFVKVYRALASLPDGPGRTPWIYRIATNTCYDVLRRRRLVAWLPWTQDHGVGAAAVADNTGERYAMREEVVEALRLVPPSLRAPLLLHAVHGFCYADIAVALGISEAAVKMRISRARAAFRQAYRSTDEEEQP